MADERDYDGEAEDNEGRQYAYDFDFAVMHGFMIRAFLPFVVPGSALELGSFRGDFTARLASHFSDLTCVEASAAAIAHARETLAGRAVFIEETFERVALNRQFENVFMTHVLEHLDDPVAILRRLNREWLAPGGRVFLACPNANAPSRLIAVKMGLIDHSAAVTDAERAHGHRRTYSLETLERDARKAGLTVLFRSGIFFKALANFQWDMVLAAGTVSPEYLEACFQLGQQYPDLCATVFLVCTTGKD